MTGSVWLLIKEAKSKSNPSKTPYKVKIHPETKVVGCDCPSWRFQGGPQNTRICKHTETVTAEEIRWVLSLQPGSEAYLVRVIHAGPPPADAVEKVSLWYARRNIQL